jgi:hypothetical protein
LSTSKRKPWRALFAPWQLVGFVRRCRLSDEACPLTSDRFSRTCDARTSLRSTCIEQSHERSEIAVIASSSPADKGPERRRCSALRPHVTGSGCHAKPVSPAEHEPVNLHSLQLIFLATAVFVVSARYGALMPQLPAWLAQQRNRFSSRRRSPLSVLGNTRDRSMPSAQCLHPCSRLFFRSANFCMALPFFPGPIKISKVRATIEIRIRSLTQLLTHRIPRYFGKERWISAGRVVTLPVPASNHWMSRSDCCLLARVATRPCRRHNRRYSRASSLGARAG